MSARTVGEVWELDLPANKKLVLLAMADHADHDGRNVFPSVGLIAWKTGYSERQVQRIIHEMTTDGLLMVVSAEKGKTVVYNINVKAGQQKPKYQAETATPDKMSPLTPDILTPPADVTPDKMSPELSLSLSLSSVVLEPKEKPKDKDIAAANATAPRVISAHQRMYQGLCDAMGVSTDDVKASGQNGDYGRVASVLLKAAFPAEDLPGLRAFTLKMARDNRWTQKPTVNALAKYFPNYRASLAKATFPQPGRYDGPATPALYRKPMTAKATS